MRSRPLRSLSAGILAIFLVSYGILFFSTERAGACSCAVLDPSPGREAIVTSTREKSEAVFVGRMQSSSLISWNDAGSKTVRFGVSRVWKGPEEEVIAIKTPIGGGGGCGYPFQPGEEYLVYAGEGMNVSLCNATRPLSESQEDIEILGDAKRTYDPVGSGGAVFGVLFRDLALAGVGLFAGAWILNVIGRRTRT